MSDYEQKRLERIRANAEMMSELGLLDAVGAIASATKRKAPARSPRPKRARTSPAAPTRSSSRLRGEAAEDRYILSETSQGIAVGAMPLTLSEGVTRRATDADGLPEVAAQPEPEADDILSVGGDMLSALSGASFSDGSDQHLSASARWRAYRLREQDKRPVLRSQKLYALAFAPSDRTLLACGDGFGRLGLWDVDAPDERDDPSGKLEEPVVMCRPHLNVVNNLQFRGSELFTFSYDDTVRVLDLAASSVSATPPRRSSSSASTARAEFTTLVDLKDEEGRLQHGTLYDHNMLALGLTCGKVLLWDLRAKSAQSHFKAHQGKVQTVDVHDSLLLTSSLTRSSSIFDLRKLSGRKGREAKPLVELPDERSVNCAFFSPKGQYIATCSQANTVSLYHNAHLKSSTEKRVEPTHRIRHDNQTGRFLAVFHLAWDPKRDDVFALGSKNRPRDVGVFRVSESSKGAGMKIVQEAHLAEPETLVSIVSRVAFHPSKEIVVAGNASGAAHVFRP
eukprot:m.4364 g.4364  ORF g.4364 m.4364 type:complete len:508 (-) comp2412_c0_seq1:102-1625(-)